MTRIAALRLDASSPSSGVMPLTLILQTDEERLKLLNELTSRPTLCTLPACLLKPAPTRQAQSTADAGTLAPGHTSLSAR